MRDYVGSWPFLGKETRIPLVKCTGLDNLICQIHTVQCIHTITIEWRTLLVHLHQIAQSYPSQSP